MDRNPYTDRIFTMAAHLKGAERTAVGIALIMTEAQTIAAAHPKLRAYIDERVPGWMSDANKVDGTKVVIAFFEFLNTGGLKEGFEFPSTATATIEA